MIGLSRRVRVFAYTRPVDMRKQYDGLYALVVSELKADPLSGDQRPVGLTVEGTFLVECQPHT